jgi:hypothetical protein
MSHGKIVFEDMPPQLEFKNGTFEVFEEGAPPTNIIRTDKAWGVRFNWELLGDLCCMIFGKWTISVYLEEMGVGEYDLKNNEKTFDFKPYPHVYGPIEMKWAAGEVPAGTYRLVATIGVMAADGVTPGPFGGFVSGPMLRFFKAPHHP